MKRLSIMTASNLLTLLFSFCFLSLEVGADLKDGLIALWLFDTAKGKVIEDSSGNKNHGELNNGAKRDVGKFGQSVVTKPQQGVDVPLSDSLNSLKEQMTIGGWFRIDEDSDTGHRRNGSYLLEDQAGGEQNPDGWVFAVWTDSGIGLAWGNKKVKQKVWTHIAGTYDGKMLSLYINGELDVSVKKDGEIANPGDPLSLGKYGAETYIGGIDEVFIYDRALSTEELNELLKGFESAFSVDPSEKLATKWATLKM